MCFRVGATRYLLTAVAQVVNKPWENSHKRGFKSVFDRGVLRLYFNFKRERYRR